MKIHARILSRLALAAGCACVASAAEFEGILIDKMCSMKAEKEGQSAAAMHTRDCALMEACQQSGYGVFTADGKFLPLDEAGNAKAVSALKASKKKDNLRVKVTGELQDGAIKVSALKLL
jgi:hypothetical protein